MGPHVNMKILRLKNNINPFHPDIFTERYMLLLNFHGDKNSVCRMLKMVSLNFQ